MAHLLVAEDDPSIRTLLELVLSIDDHQLDFAADGKETLNYLKQHTPDLIILDINMPYINGLDICHRIRLIDRFDKTAIVILTALEDSKTVEAVSQAGADLYLVKPLAGLDLRSSIRELLEERQKASS